MLLWMILSLAASCLALPSKTGCYFDGFTYNAGDQITIGSCLGAMTCLGNNNYGDLQQWGGVCPNKRAENGQTGCLFNGRVYQTNEKIVFAGCLGEMTCIGHNSYSNLKSLYGICPSEQHRRSVDGQTGCLFDGRVYGKGEDIEIAHCLGKMECLGNNNLGPIQPLYGNCNLRRGVDGQTGCWFDGHVYNTGETIQIIGTKSKLLCMGQNIYKEL